MPTPESHRLPTEFVRVSLRGPQGKRITAWAKPLPAAPGRRLYLRVSKEGEVPSSFNAAANVVTETREIIVATDADVVNEKPAFFSLTYGELEVLP
jgi:hypothetical protein